MSIVLHTSGIAATGGGASQVAEADGARSRTGLVHDDHHVSFEPARSGRELGKLPSGELGRLGVGLESLAEVGLGSRLGITALHDESAQRENRFAIEPALLRQSRERCPGEPLSFRRHWRSCTWTAPSF